MPFNKIHIIVEGNTEAEFVKNLMSYYFANKYNTQVAREIGLNTIMSKCRYFEQWIKKLESKLYEN